MKKSVLVLFLAVPCLVSLVRAEDTFLGHLRYLASDELQGRGNGTPELDKAASYIAERFQAYGLLPAGEGGTYFQEFDLAMGRKLGSENSITFHIGKRKIRLESGTDFVPLTSGPHITIKGPAVFAGFGISAPELNYDDYRELDVRNKIVLVFEHEPQEQVPESVFAGDELSPYATTLHKILNARSRGANGVLLLPDHFNHPESDATDFSDVNQVEHLGIHAVKLSRKWSGQLIRASGRDFNEIDRWINDQLTPYSFRTGFDAEVSVDVISVQRTVKNVLGLVSGQTDGVIVVGAHYDHLGLGDKTSLAPELVGQIHNGADDNASGTAGLLQLAQEFGRTSPKRGLLFIAFAGEELGLLGSRFYAEHATVSLEKTVAMLNLDMIGRSDGDLLVGGVGTATEFREILDELQASSSLSFTYSDNLRGSSDHLAFSAKRIPVLFFFSGLHRDYHRPSDDWERIDLVRTQEVLDVIHGTLNELTTLEQPLVYRDLARPSHSGRSAGRRYGPRFGSLIDMSWEFEGVRLREIVAGSPAARAGLKGGDVLVGFDGQSVKTLYDFTTALRRKAPGDQVEAVVLRDGEVIRTTVQLDTRR